MNYPGNDLFICHASEDKVKVVRPLYYALEAEGFNIWYDEAEIRWGDSITQRINWGLIHSKYVVVVLSESFLDKEWPQREFNSVVNIESSTSQVKVLPLLVGSESVIERIVNTYPLIGDKRYLQWNDSTEEIISELFKLFPERLRQNDISITRRPRIKDIPPLVFSPRSNIQFNCQVVMSLCDQKKVGILIDPVEIDGLPFLDVVEHFSAVKKGSTIVGRYINEAMWWVSNHLAVSDGLLFLEVPSHLDETDFITECVFVGARDSDINVERIVILVPENIVTECAEDTYRLLGSLRNRGVKIGMSHFGSGYSSFALLRRFSFDYIFVDNYFLRDDNESGQGEILKAISSICNTLQGTAGMDGIETSEQRVFLQNLGFDLSASILSK